MSEEKNSQTNSELTEKSETQEKIQADNEPLKNEDVVSASIEAQPSMPVDNKGRKKKIIFALSAVVFVAVLVLLTINVFIPASKYNKAVKLDAAGSYDEAIAIFSELGDYKDSIELKAETEKHKAEALLKAKIADAQKLYDTGDKLGAYKMLLPEKDKEGVSEILSDYEKKIIEEAGADVFWDEDEMSDYHWAYSKKLDTNWGLNDPYFYIYLSQSKEEPADLTVFLFLQFAHGDRYKFTTPVHPNTIRFRGNDKTIDIPVALSERSFDTSDDGYWIENMHVSITPEQANEISAMFAGDSDVKIRVMGSSKSLDYTLSSARRAGVEGIVEFINVMYSVYDTETE
ncbi:MAG: hypothetical protein IJZ07_03540 [Clostridia bacterium]|nr:hypothetical protein [Clostridia bacterium]